MALIKCPECGQEISDLAKDCPHCGCPINEQKPILVKKDYKAKAKAFTIAGVIVFLVTGVISIASYDAMLGLKAQYFYGSGGAYPVYNFIENLFTWLGIGMIVIGIIYWIIYFSNRNK